MYWCRSTRRGWRSRSDGWRRESKSVHLSTKPKLFYGRWFVRDRLILQDHSKERMAGLGQFLEGFVKIRHFILAALTFVILAGSVVPAEAAGHRHHKKHHHKK